MKKLKNFIKEWRVGYLIFLSLFFLILLGVYFTVDVANLDNELTIFLYFTIPIIISIPLATIFFILCDSYEERNIRDWSFPYLLILFGIFGFLIAMIIEAPKTISIISIMLFTLIIVREFYINLKKKILTIYYLGLKL